mmetsp:Transcript_71535/g.128781  ORF Transcript_71535/g.128781 Transcript_71535/m.128781 type:complete len:277 (+) Transcript_71535:582-1412(+)
MKLSGLQLRSRFIGFSQALVPLRPHASNQQRLVATTGVALHHVLKRLLSKDGLCRFELPVRPSAKEFAQQAIVGSPAHHALFKQLRVEFDILGQHALHEVLEITLKHTSQLAICHLAQGLFVALLVNLIHALELLLRQRAENTDKLVLICPPALHGFVHKVRIPGSTELHHAAVVFQHLVQEVVEIFQALRPLWHHRVPAGRVISLSALPEAVDHFCLHLHVFQQLLSFFHFGRLPLQEVGPVWMDENRPRGRHFVVGVAAADEDVLHAAEHQRSF